MKRLMIIFASITLVASSTSSVVACNKRQVNIPGNLIKPSTRTNQGIANDIKTSITKAIQTTTEIKISKNYLDLQNPTTIAALNQALQEQAGLNLSGSTGDPTNPTTTPPLANELT